MSYIYDKDGNRIDLSVSMTQEQATHALVEGITNGSIVLPMVSTTGQTLSVGTGYFGSASWVENEHTAYNLMFTRYKELGGEAVPFFATTDQHGLGLNGNRQANNIDTDGIEFTNLNCGDTDPDVYYEPTIEGYREQTKYVKNYAGVVGNHDLKGVTENGIDHAHYVIRRGFHTTRPNAKYINNELDSYSFVDGKHGCKFIILDLYDLRGFGGNNMPHPYINKETAKWLIDELKNSDNCDIVVVSHEPDFGSGVTIENRDGDSSVSDGGYGLRSLLLARKNKTSGTYTDSENVSHTYDFTSCGTELLGTLHGHWHQERYGNSDGLATYVFMNGQTGTFGLFDRKNSLLRIYRFNESVVRDELTIAI